jgi:hypothetical protein
MLWWDSLVQDGSVAISWYRELISKKILKGPKFDEPFFAARPDCESGDPSACTVQWRGRTSHHGVHLPLGPCVAIVSVARGALHHLAAALPPDTFLAIVFLSVPEVFPPSLPPPAHLLMSPTSR